MPVGFPFSLSSPDTELAPLQGAGSVNLELAEVSVGCRYGRSTAGRFDLYMFM